MKCECGKNIFECPVPWVVIVIVLVGVLAVFLTS